MRIGASDGAAPVPAGRATRRGGGGLPPAHRQRPPEAADEVGEAARQQDDDGHEGRPQEELPEERQVAGQVRREVVDRDGAQHRAEQRAAAAERHPDHQLGAEQEAGILGRDHARGVGEQEAREPRDPGERRGQPDLQPPRVEAEIGAARLVVPERHEGAARIGPDQDPGRQRDDDQEQGREAEIALDLEGQHVEADEAAAGAGPFPARVDELHHDDRDDERDHRGVERGRAVVEGQPPHREAEQGRRDQRGRDGRGDPERRRPAGGEDHRGGVGADAEERRLPEGQNPGEAPEQVDRDRQHRVDHRPGQDVDREGVEEQRRDPEGQRREGRDHEGRGAGQAASAGRRGGALGDGKGLKHGRNLSG